MDQHTEPRLVMRRVRADQHAVLVYLAGELDLDTTRLLVEDFVQLALHRDDHHRVLLNLSDITYCDPGSLFTLLGLCNALHAIGVLVTITDLSTAVRTMITLVGLGDQLPLHRP
ncbi:STAS domain-containing protein [Streptomyces minutiscleroticus]|uniref:STAS domain-containing protein n=1 Tax=Streptomyces minutiscleroticus TaxID=68238 RepID=A0A918ND57_9ACTN|nr:STAS domain-containing protein [Streptomyces minutiscleroticus]GGX58791.1 hypothetical protein GCM10010358_11130 [Streptomyces minutiscleroticus]